jgi:CspA family cold shock protein
MLCLDESASRYGAVLVAGRETGEDAFVHFSSIRGEGYRSLEEGKKAEFVVSGEKGSQAQDATLL